MPPRPRFDRRAPERELPNINERISHPNLRVVDSDGTQLGVISREEALEVAKERELDIMNANKDRVFPKSKHQAEIDRKMKFWKENADKLLTINAHNKDKWSRY